MSRAEQGILYGSLGGEASCISEAGIGKHPWFWRETLRQPLLITALYILLCSFSWPLSFVGSRCACHDNVRGHARCVKKRLEVKV